MNPFIEFLNKITPLSPEIVTAINNITIQKSLSRGDLLLRNGEVCREFHFISKGLARVYYLKNGREVTAWFAAEGGIVSAIDSLFSGQTSFYHIELLEDSEIYSLQYHQLEPIFDRYPIVERLGRLLITQNYLLLDERVKLFAFCTADERYEKLLAQLPNIFKRAKLGFIASYLGITQEHLSRIRAGYRK